ncbi:MAG: cobalt ECF transporter T component CbiQ [Acidimicrobiia bacterium]
MSAGHGGHGGVGGLYLDASTPVHALAPEAKLAATVAFVLAVVITPRHAVWAFAVDLAVLVSVAAMAQLSPAVVVRRMRVEVPFLAFALFLPFVGGGPHADMLGLSLSEPGLWAAWNIVVKGTLGVMASVVLAATTPVGDLLRGLDRLGLPRPITAIAGFMVRYLDVIIGEARRAQVARLSRADDPRWLWQAKGLAAGSGTLFVRAYERGERVYLAMCSRGYAGAMPELDDRSARGPSRAWAAAAPMVAAMAAVGALAT